MIDRIPRRVVSPLIGFIRAQPSSSRPLSIHHTPRPSTLQHKRLQHLPKRFYATPTPNDPKKQPQLATEPPGGTNPTSAQPFPQDPASFPAHPEQPSASQPRPKRSLRPYIYATIFFIIGAASGQYVRLVIAPPPLPTPGTAEDAALSLHIRKQGEKLPLVQSLSSSAAWRSWDAYSTVTAEEKPHRFTTGPLGGSRGLGGFQRIFHNAATGEFVSVVWIGGALAGWPGVAHGGLVATLLDENMGRCGIARFAVPSGVTAVLECNYKKPTVTNAFYVLRSLPVSEGSSDRKSWVNGRVETLDGKVCVEGKGLFVLPKKLEVGPLGPVEMKKLNEGF